MEGADDWPAPDGGRLERAESWCETESVGSACSAPGGAARALRRAVGSSGEARSARGTPARFDRLHAQGPDARRSQGALSSPSLQGRRSAGSAAALPRKAGFASPAGTPTSAKRHSVPTASPRPNGFARPRPRGSLAAALSEAAAGSPEAGRPAGRDSVRDSLGIVEPAGAPAHGPPGRPKGDVAVCVRLRPGPRHDVCISVQNANCVRLQCWDDVRGTGNSGPIYWCDHAFGPEASQEEVYDVAVAPICASVLEGYNGAVLAYGQTGSGKTHTIIGDAQHRGVIPRAVATIIDTLRDRRHWSVEVCMLEIYNERTRDLLAPGQSVCQVDIHEVQDAAGVSSFQCPGATRRAVRSAEEVLSALVEGLRRRETAHTDMNHNSSRSHLIFTLDVTQVDDALGATLRGRLHLVDLAGSERLKRSMASQASSVNERDLLPSSKSPRDLNAQRKEAGAINKSLAQLALVIQRLSSGGSLRHVPYRDSMLTRLLADSFGGSSKTCLIITCSSLERDREETRGTLEFGKRAGLVRNVAQINIEMAQEPSEVVKALLAKELAEMTKEKEALQLKVCEAAAEVLQLQRLRAQDVRRLEEENGALEEELRRTREEQSETHRLVQAALAVSSQAQDRRAAADAARADGDGLGAAAAPRLPPPGSDPEERARLRSARLEGLENDAVRLQARWGSLAAGLQAGAEAAGQGWEDVASESPAASGGPGEPPPWADPRRADFGGASGLALRSSSGSSLREDPEDASVHGSAAPDAQ